MGLFDRIGGLLGDGEAREASGSAASVTGVRSVAATDRDPAEPLPERAVRERRDGARRLAEEWPGYDLDFGPASLERLDDLIAREFDGSPPDADRESTIAASPPGAVPENATLALGTGGDTARLAAYHGEVYRRSYDAAWVDGDGVAQLRLAGSDGVAHLAPRPLVSAAVQGYVSLARVHDDVADDLGLDGA